MRVKQVGYPSGKSAFIAYSRNRLIVAERGDHWFYIVPGTEEDWVRAGSYADFIELKRKATKKQYVIFAVANQALFISKANTL